MTSVDGWIPGATYENVTSFDIVMNDTVLMDILKGVKHLICYGLGFPRRE